MNEESDAFKDFPFQLSDDLKYFAAELARLRPRDDRLDRERLAFLAGQASVVVDRSRRTKVLGLPVENGAWPTAFAAMTVIAACLFLALLMRPNSGPSIANQRVDRQVLPIAVQSGTDNDILSTRDARLANFESWLAKHDPKPTRRGVSSLTSEEPAAPVLTPNAWHQVISEAQSAKPLPEDASGLSQNKGVNS
jgi:hypothetical protein